MTQSEKVTRLLGLQSQATVIQEMIDELKADVVEEASEWIIVNGNHVYWDDSATITTKKGQSIGGGYMLVVEEPREVLDTEAALELAIEKGLSCVVQSLDKDMFLAEVQGGAVTPEELESVMTMATPKKPYLKIISKKPFITNTEE